MDSRRGHTAMQILTGSFVYASVSPAMSARRTSPSWGHTCHRRFARTHSRALASALECTRTREASTSMNATGAPSAACCVQSPTIPLPMSCGREGGSLDMSTSTDSTR